MEVENSQIWDRIAHSVLEDDYEEYSQLYHIRLKFLCTGYIGIPY